MVWGAVVTATRANNQAQNPEHTLAKVADMWFGPDPAKGGYIHTPQQHELVPLLQGVEQV